MKTIFISVLLLFAACPNPNQQAVSEDRFELIPEPDKDLREKYEKRVADSIAALKSIHFPSDSFLLSVSAYENDIIINDYRTEDLKPIRENFKRINSIIDWISIKKTDLWETTEGGQAEFFYSEDRLEKIEVRYFGETRQRLIEYYLMDEELSFVFDKDIIYNRPLYWDSLSMRENNDDQVFDFKNSEILESRSYFKDEKLLHQLNSGDCGSPFAEEYLTNEAERIYSEFERILSL